jgi:hypothetical protein
MHRRVNSIRLVFIFITPPPRCESVVMTQDNGPHAAANQRRLVQSISPKSREIHGYENLKNQLFSLAALPRLII